MSHVGFQVKVRIAGVQLDIRIFMGSDIFKSFDMYRGYMITYVV